MNIKTYQSGLKFMLINAVKRLFNGEVIFHYSLDHGMKCSIISDEIIDEEKINDIKKLMNNMVKKDIPFNKKVISKKDAYNFFKNKNEIEKANNILNISNSTVTLFEFEGRYNYFYSDMPKSTSELSIFDLYYVKENEFVLTYPVNDELTFTFRNKINESFTGYDNWLNNLNINYVSDVNRIVAEGKSLDLIKKNDIMVDNHLYEIAKQTIDNNKKVILIAGPSSSGKTTTSRKLSLYLSSFGFNAYPISIDDFFVNRNETPLDENGNKDYECLEAIDLNLFNEKIKDLLDGKETIMPRYNFIKGEKEFKDNSIKIEDNDILVIEGLHALNPNILTSIDPQVCYKIYVSPLTPLNVDRHNYISTTDNRLIRRIVRDFQTRGRSAEESLETWASVRKGEEKYIFPFTDQCDAIVNTAFVYEIGVLKVYVEPLLYSIDIESPYYDEARRLLDNLKTFYPIPSEYVSHDNVLREFIGGSNFEEE